MQCALRRVEVRLVRVKCPWSVGVGVGIACASEAD